MKDIGILTFHDTCNYGAVLQAYATFLAVSRLGYDAEIIDYKCPEISKREIPAERLKNSKTFRSLIGWLIRGKKEQKKYIELRDYLKNNTKISNKTYYKENIKDVSNEYKIVLVGSDMLWCTFFTNSDYSFMLEGVKGCKKIAFATSGGFMWDDNEDDTIIGLLKDFSFIAVREKDTAERLSRRLNREIFNVCDPTMLFEPQEWRAMIKEKEKNEGSILVYMDDEKKSCRNSAKLYAENNRKIEIIGFKGLIPRKNIIKEIYSIQDFLSSIYCASMVFTSSYHGLLFALYYHTPFVYFNKDSIRMSTLAERLGIGYRDGNKIPVSEMKQIDWNDIDYNLNSFRCESNEILKGILRSIDD